MNWKVAAITVATIGGLGIGRFLLAGQPESPFHIYGITHVEILSTNVLNTRAYYKKALDVREDGCSLCDKLPGPLLLNGSQEILISKAPTPVPSNLLSEITFSADNVRQLRRDLKEQNIQIVDPAENENRADRYLSVLDPEGHRISFTQNIGVPGSKPIVAKSTNLHLIHAGFIVRNRASTEHFYKDILGFRPYWHGGMKDDQTDWVSMQVPDGTDWLEFMVNVEPDADQKLRGIMNHIAIGVPDIHATQKKLIENGVKLTEEPQIGRDGKWQLNLYDPDLTRVEFMEFTPVQKPCCSDFTGPHPGPQPPSKAPAKP